MHQLLTKASLNLEHSRVLHPTSNVDIMVNTCYTSNVCSASLCLQYGHKLVTSPVGTTQLLLTSMLALNVLPFNRRTIGICLFSWIYLLPPDRIMVKKLLMDSCASFHHCSIYIYIYIYWGLHDKNAYLVSSLCSVQCAAGSHYKYVYSRVNDRNWCHR